MSFSTLMLLHVVILFFVVRPSMLPSTIWSPWQPWHRGACGTLSLSGIIGLLHPHHLTPLEEFSYRRCLLLQQRLLRHLILLLGPDYLISATIENYPDRPQILTLGELLERSCIFEGNLRSVVSTRQKVDWLYYWWHIHCGKQCSLWQLSTGILLEKKRSRRNSCLRYLNFLRNSPLGHFIFRNSTVSL